MDGFDGWLAKDVAINKKHLVRYVSPSKTRHEQFIGTVEFQLRTCRSELLQVSRGVLLPNGCRVGRASGSVCA